MIKIALSGTLGKMGKSLVQEIYKDKKTTLSVAIISNNQFISKNKNTILNELKKNNVFISTSLEKVCHKFDVLIDFSSIDKTLENIKICYKNRKKVVIGTTGFSSDEQKNIFKLSNKIGIVQSSNFSIGINLVLQLIDKVAKTIGSDSDIEIIEEHHSEKKDAPSGTAITLGKKIANAMNNDFKKMAIYSRVGNIGVRKKNTIGFSVIRTGSTIGNHTVVFANKHEHIKIIHKAIDRSIFAKGAIKSAIWLFKKDKGFFSMNDVLKL
ncbi:4-hydroxy-tetrahydrodipicolinate reductase [Buchnera aphidicola]|uniref:4-hydroxy-tetrahydrodipicolinate reductase n=1 Tax=Buchnera aphidicola (Anoecia oenotherae) TaxID=1241833 RepID=A0A4D6XZ14_9GAMM|nr:4-hydroxy-tetrahydrodipicolinate reductase [Buchnera aphidicola]QCI19250.1 4-hydroxy-tetrahydrodipicolinate reductase [Buchnera aphidicola (Anoecia oenotherae)]